MCSPVMMRNMCWAPAHIAIHEHAMQSLKGFMAMHMHYGRCQCRAGVGRIYSCLARAVAAALRRTVMM